MITILCTMYVCMRSRYSVHYNTCTCMYIHMLHVSVPNLGFCIKLVVLVMNELGRLHIFSNITPAIEGLFSSGLQPAPHLGEREGGRERVGE